MIKAVAEQSLDRGTMCLLEPGSLRLRAVREGETPTFTTVVPLAAGEAVDVVPLDTTVLMMRGVGIEVRPIRDNPQA